MARCSIQSERETAVITDHETWHQKIACIWEASLCFEYLKTYLLPKLGGQIPLVSSTERTVMEQKNKGGRPTKTLSEKRKYQVLLRLNTMEYYTLLGKAREASITRTEFLRRLITKAEVKARITPEEMQLIRTVSGMANNLNQIAHRLNAIGIYALNEDLNALKVLIHELIKRLKP